MQVFALGISHRTAPLAIREQLAFDLTGLPSALHDLARQHSVREAAILSTCNRTEVYCAAENAEAATDWLTHYRALPVLAQIEPYIYVHPQRDAVRHMFRVASGLDSMVIGEPQILGQMKQAARVAEEAGTLGTMLNKLFQSTFAVAKEVRSTTAIGANTVSMAAAAVRFASRIFESVGEQKILFIGAGEMIELCLRHFAAEKPRHITIANRTPARAEALAAKYGTHNVDTMQLDELGARIADYDVVVSCTASPLPIVGLGTIERALKQRRHRPMVLVDLAIPRDIEAEVGKLNDAFLYTLDDLSEFVAEGMESRQAAVTEAEAIIAGRVDGFLHWVDSRAAVPTIKALREAAENARHAEVEHALRLLARGDDPGKVLEVLSHGLTNKLLHAPTQLLSHADNSERRQLAEIIERIYQLKPLD